MKDVKFKYSVYCQMKDEDVLLPFFIDHYINNLKFDHIFIFDDNSKNPIDEIDFIVNLINSNKITVKRITTDINDFSTINEKFVNSFFYDKDLVTCKYMRQQYFSNFFTKKFKNDLEWVLFIDGDEFLYLKNHESINDFIEEYKQNYDIHTLNLQWLVYGSSYNSYFPIDKHIFESFLLTNYYLDIHTKVLANVHKINKILIHEAETPSKEKNFFLKPNSNELLPITEFENNYHYCNKIISDRKNNYIKPNEVSAFIGHFIVTDCFNFTYRRFIRKRASVDLTREKQNSSWINGYNNSYSSFFLKYINDAKPIISQSIKLNKKIDIAKYNQMYNTNFSDLYSMLIHFYSNKTSIFYS
jgi:hypothetical protein